MMLFVRYYFCKILDSLKSVSASQIAGGSRESLLLEVILELVLKVKEIWMTEIAP